MTETATQVLEPIVTDRERVESWRMHNLIEAGYPVPLAERLALSEADLHQACELVKRCAPELATKILL